MVLRLQDLEYIAFNLREIDRPEVHGIRWDDDPFTLALQTKHLVESLGRGWVLKHNGRPAAMVGVVEVHPGVWQGLAYGTDDFGQVIKELTRVVRTDLRPFIMDHGAHRLEVLSRYDHEASHRWLVYLGATREGVMRKYGKDGADFYRFAWVKG